MTTPTIAVWFSSGAASAIGAFKALETFSGKCNIRIINNPIKEEDEDNLRFLYDVERALGVKIEFAINPKFPDCSAEAVWEQRRFMSGTKGAPCTMELKKRAREIFEMDNDIDFHVLGFTAEERARFNNFVELERRIAFNVLGDAGITKADCYRGLKRLGLKLPRIYSEGYPNANCIGCVKASSPTYWNHVRKTRPGIFKRRAELSREIGARLVRVNGARIFLDELSPDAKGRPMKNLDFECGIFCGAERGDK